MLRQPPYYLWLILALCCWAVAALLYAGNRQDRTAWTAAKLEHRLQRQQADFHRLLADTTVTSALRQDPLPAAVAARLSDADYFIYTGRPGMLFYWNNDRMADSSLVSEELPLGRPVFFKQLPYLGIAERHALDSLTCVTAFFPLATVYPFENNYLQSRLANGSAFSPGTQLSEQATDGAAALRDAGGHVLAYLKMPKTGHPKPGVAVIALALAGLLLLLLWLQLLALHLSLCGKGGRGFLLLFLAAVVLRVLAYVPGLPLGFSELPLFAPQLYSTNMLLPSLGDLMIYALLLLWLTWYAALRLSPSKLLGLSFRDWPATPARRWLVALLLCLLAVIYYYLILFLIKSLVLNSTGFSFSADALRHVSWLSVLGIGIVACLTLSLALLLFFVARATCQLWGNAWLKYIAVLGLAALATVFFPWVRQQLQPGIALLWLALALLLLDAGHRQLRYGPAELPVVMTGLFFAASVTPLLHAYYHQKSVILQQVFAERVATEADNRLEWYFPTLALRLQSDPSLLHFLADPNSENRQNLNRQINAYYLTSWLSNYTANLLLFDDQGQPLYNDENKSMAYYEQVLDSAVATADAGLYYRGDKDNKNTYLARLEIYDGGLRAGFLYLELSRKKSTNDRVLPELFLPARLITNPTEQAFSYAVYEGNRIVTQSTDHPFPYYLQASDTSGTVFQRGTDQELLRYQTDNGRTVLVLLTSHGWLDVLLFFSIVFALFTLLVLLLTAATLLAYWLGSIPMPWHLSLRRRVQLAMVLLLFFSFVLMGWATTRLIGAYYRHNTEAQRLATLELISNRIEQYVHEQRKTKMQLPDTDPELKLILARQAYNHNVDIHLYDNFGQLRYTTRDELFNNRLRALLLRPDVLRKEWNLLSSAFVTTEQIGKLTFTSCYLPLMNSEGTPEFYLNVPFFSSEKELSAQISYVAVALVNVYILLLLLSGLLTVPLTNWLSRSLQTIIRHLEQTGVTGNEPLHWPHDDEIGLLVREYNKMVKKVEAGAAMLARSERESAWREVARQVAHEIKNPLTPMKLNIQYLQQAMAQNRPDVLTLAQRVSHTLVEQIDHLAHIAGSFSAFAAMPAPQPEKLELTAFLKRAATLHQEAARVAVELVLPADEVFVFADRNHLLSILTNLMQNAAQAIPESQADGRIVLSLSVAENTARIVVADNGPGIPEDVREKLFTPYFTTKSSGTGLGLAMTRRLVEGAGGRIWFESESGVGTSFFIELPVV